MKYSDAVLMKLTNERVWRTYLGGSLLDELHGQSEREDGHFPEEWIASMVAARNVGREGIQDEGLSRLAEAPQDYLRDVIKANPERYLGKAHANSFGASMGVLVKLIDSSERLAIQVHPDRNQARKLFHSDYGKTECWHILGGREIDGVAPCVYVGFKEGVSREQWQRLFEAQDIQGMLDCLHCYQVHTGDTILIEGGVPHAIGAGCFLVEIQEPTDYTIRVERTTPSGFTVEDSMCHQGIGFERMFECFDYENLSREENYKRRFISPVCRREDAGGRLTSLIGYCNTKYFKMEELLVAGKMTVEESESFAVIYVIGGSGTLNIANTVRELRTGEQYFLPANSGRMMFQCGGNGTDEMRILCCFGPQAADQGLCGD